MTTIKYNRFKDKYYVGGTEVTLLFLYRNRFNKSILKDIASYATKTNTREFHIKSNVNVVNNVAYILEPSTKVLHRLVRNNKQNYYLQKRKNNERF